MTFGNCVAKKAKRLLLPSMLFSVIYLLLMGNYDMSPLSVVSRIVNGYGHLWYLPMLFWCFVMIWIIEYIGVGPKFALPLLFICAAVLSVKDLPLRIDEALYYMLFFYVGYVVNRYAVCLDKYYAWRYVLIFAIIYCFTFIPLHLLERGGFFVDDESFLIKLANLSVGKLSHIVYSSAALATVFVTVNMLVRKTGVQIKAWMVRGSTLCFGVYIYHQMIIDFAYYRMGWIETLPPMLLPWIGFVSALVFSLLLAYLTLKTKFGRFLIG